MALAARISGVTLSDRPDPQADINYYIPLQNARPPKATRVAGWVQDTAPSGLDDVDLVICPDTDTQAAVRQAGVEHVVVSPPGLGADVLDADLVIGVAGQAEDVSAVQMPGITWRYIEADAQNALEICRAVDCLLVPHPSGFGVSLACTARAAGTPVIACDAPALGSLEHSGFPTGDAEGLQRALSAFVEAAHQQRRAVAAQSWNIFADIHAQAFETLDLTAFSGGGAQAGAAFPGPIRLLLHGDEHQARGGPSVRVPRTAEVLRTQGVAAQAGAYTGAADISEPMVHLFNVWDPASALVACEQLKAAGKRVVLSPIYLDLRAYGFWQGQLPQLPLGDLETHAVSYQKAMTHLSGRGRLSEPVAGYHAMVRAMLDMADHVIFLSQAEREALEEIGASVEDDRASLVPNPVDAKLWQAGEPDLFRETYLADLPGPQDYVLCVGRIEPRKNQLLLARALRDLPLRLVLVGHEGDRAYAGRVRDAAGPDLLIVDRLDAAGEMLRSAVAGARMFCLPSWAEGASLAALEAAAAGAPLVLGDRSSERAYFGDLAEYCDVGDPRSIAEAITRCLDCSADERETRAQALSAKVAQDYSWQAHATATARAYARAAKGPLRMPAPAATGRDAPAVRNRLVLDLTVLATAEAPRDSQALAAASLAQALSAVATDLRFICWSDEVADFVELPAASAAPLRAWRYLTQGIDLPPVRMTPDCTLVVAGNTWRQNAQYLSGLADLKARNGCAVLPIVQDLDPLIAPFRHDAAKVSAVLLSFNRLARIADGFLPVSQATAGRTRDAVARLMADVPPITPIRPGDPVVEQGRDDAGNMLHRTWRTRRYVLAAGPVDARANLDMLLDIWARFAETGVQENLHLVIAGDVALCASHIPDRVARDPRLARRLHILSGLGEDDLAWLHHNCLFTVYPAHDSDWAAPVAQSLAYAKPCLSSSLGAAPEIAPDLVEHIDPMDFPAWYGHVARYAASPALRDRRREAIERGYHAVSWEQTAQKLMDVLQEPRPRRMAVPVFIGVPIEAGSQGNVMQALFGKGWLPRESWGRWAAASGCEVTVNLSRQAVDSDVSIPVLMHLRFCPGPGRAEQVKIKVGTAVLFEAPLYDDLGEDGTSRCDIIVAVPVEALDAQGRVTFVFEGPLTWERCDPPAAARRLGIGLVRMVVLDAVRYNPLHSLSTPHLWSVGDSGLRIDMVEPEHRAAIGALGVGGAHEFSPAWGLGSRAGRCDIAVPVLPGAPAQTLFITCRPVASKAHPVTAQFYWNGRCITEGEWTSDRTVRIEIALSAEDFAGPAPALLTLRSNSQLVPVDLGLGPADHIAGIGLLDLELVPETQVT